MKRLLKIAAVLAVVVFVLANVAGMFLGEEQTKTAATDFDQAKPPLAKPLRSVELRGSGHTPHDWMKHHLPDRSTI